MAYRKRHNGTTQQRGYGNAHQQLRRALLARWSPGDPCARCGRPMWDRRFIDLGHTADRTGYVGLEHRACNRGEAARRGNRQRARVGTAAPRWPSARRW